MKFCLPFICLLLSSSLFAQQPNILFIYVDDLGWKDTGYMGSDFYETPAIDELAAGGVIFTNAYSCAANCAPARASLMSGGYTPRHKIFNVGTKARGKAKHRRLLHVPGVRTLDPKIKTWAHQLKSVGYRTASIGKWHLSDDPLEYGFDVNVGGSHAGSPPRGYYPPHNPLPGLKDKGADDDEYLTDRLNRQAVNFIRENKSRPWCVYLTHFAVHTPLDAKKELVKKYRKKNPGKLHDHVAMATMIEAVDRGVEEIIDTLDELQLRENTLVIFSSDNGGYGPATDMEPLKGYKGTYYEGGIRVPMLVNWPGRIEPKRSIDEPVIGVDIYPTLCEFAGATVPDGQAIDGVSLVELLTTGRPLKPRSLFWHFPAYLQSYGAVCQEQRDVLFRSRPCSVIRAGDWKLHYFFEDGQSELYNLRADVGESKNVFQSEPEKAAELTRELSSWQQRTAAPNQLAKNPAFDAEKEASAIQRIESKLKR